MKYLFSRQYKTWIDEAKSVQFTRCKDGFAIVAGSLLGSGFEPYHLNGLTLPEEIHGTRVTELRGRYHQEEVGYIEATKLKRINIEVIVDGYRNHGSRSVDFHNY